MPLQVSIDEIFFSKKIKMKTKIKSLLSLLVIALVLTSCNKDDDSADNSIVGTFIATDFKSEMLSYDYNEDGTISSNLLVEAPCLEYTITFSADKTYTLNYTPFDVDDNNGIVTYVCGGPYLVTGTYKLNGNTLAANIITNTDPDTDDDTGFDNSNIVITAEGVTITPDVSIFGELVFVFDRQ